MVHSALYNQNIEADIVPCDQWTDFSPYKMLIIPPLYVANNVLLEKIDQFVKNGGYVVMFFKSGYCNEHSAVRAEPAPGPLRKACGFYYQEYANIPSMKLKDNTFGLSGDQISEWYEFLIPETAKPLAYADHPFYGQWPVITENTYGNGKLIYIGAYPTQELLEKIVLQTAKEAGLTTKVNDFRFPVIFRSGKNQSGKNIHYVFNFSDKSQTVKNPYPNGKELISGVKSGETITLKAWDVAIVEE
jgi:beta-galactosidase